MSNYIRMSPKQSLAMMEFMEKNPELVLGKPKNPAAVKMLWYYLTRKLNEMRGGVKKTTALWMKSWADKKCTLKKKLLKHGLPKEDDDSGPQYKYSSLEMRTIKLLMQEGEVTQNEIDEAVAKKARIKEMIETEKSFRSSNQHIKNENDDDSDTYIEYLDPDFNEDLEDTLEKASPTINSTEKIRNLKRHHSPSPSNELQPNELQTEFSHVALIEEKRLEAEERSCKARKNMAASLRRCASAIRALVEAVNHQAMVVPAAYETQGELIQEAQKLQGEMIAKAIANR